MIQHMALIVSLQSFRNTILLRYEISASVEVRLRFLIYWEDCIFKIKEILFKFLSMRKLM